MWVIEYINDSAQIFPNDQLATCYLPLITLLIQWHEKSSFLFQIKCPMDIIFPKASLHLCTVVIDWGREVRTVSNEMERLVGVKLAFVSLGWNDKVGTRTSAAWMTNDWRPIKRQSEEGDEKNGWRCGREAYGFVLDNELFNRHRSAGKETVDQGSTLKALLGISG